MNSKENNEKSKLLDQVDSPCHSPKMTPASSHSNLAVASTLTSSAALPDQVSEHLNFDRIRKSTQIVVSEQIKSL